MPIRVRGMKSPVLLVVRDTVSKDQSCYKAAVFSDWHIPGSVTFLHVKAIGSHTYKEVTW